MGHFELPEVIYREYRDIYHKPKGEIGLCFSVPTFRDPSCFFHHGFQPQKQGYQPPVVCIFFPPMG